MPQNAKKDNFWQNKKSQKIRFSSKFRLLLFSNIGRANVSMPAERPNIKLKKKGTNKLETHGLGDFGHIFGFI